MHRRTFIRNSCLLKRPRQIQQQFSNYSVSLQFLCPTMTILYQELQHLLSTYMYQTSCYLLWKRNGRKKEGKTRKASKILTPQTYTC